MTFLTFPKYSSYSMWVRWANLQLSNVKFLQDSVCQKWLKSVHFWRSYSKIIMWSFFWGHSVETYSRLLTSYVKPLLSIPTIWRGNAMTIDIVEIITLPHFMYTCTGTTVSTHFLSCGNPSEQQQQPARYHAETGVGDVLLWSCPPCAWRLLMSAARFRVTGDHN